MFKDVCSRRAVVGAMIAGLLLVAHAAPAQETAKPRPPASAPSPADGRPPAPQSRTAKPRQASPSSRAPAPTPRQVAVRGEVIFIGGYYYDPFSGPYPWWPRPHRPWYFPVYDYRAEVHVKVTPKDAFVYVDGFYAGIVDDFDGMFQRLLLPPGGHSITLFREGMRTEQRHLYLHPGSDMTLRFAMEPLAPGQTSERPAVAPPIEPPPPGSYRLPRTPPAVEIPPAQQTEAQGFGTLELRVKPSDADVVVDGQRWESSEPGHFTIDLASGRHRLEISKAGQRTYSREVEIRESKMTMVNVSLAPELR